MKYLILFLLCLLGYAKPLPYADDTDQLYRCLVPGIGGNTKIGGLYQKVLPPKILLQSKEDIELYYQKQMADIKLAHEKALQERDQKAAEKEANNRATAMKWGNILFFGGLALFVSGLLVACILKAYKMETFGVVILAAGAVSFSVGAVLIGAVKHYEATVYTVIGLVVSCGIVMLFHGKGLDIKLPRRSKNA